LSVSWSQKQRQLSLQQPQQEEKEEKQNAVRPTTIHEGHMCWLPCLEGGGIPPGHGRSSPHS
jgi:hypothetical protein